MADETPTAIKISNVSKQFLLPHEKVSSLKGAFTSMLHRDKTYTTQKALDDISFEIKQGEFFGIVGRNGSGKSTLLKIIAGIYQPTEGSVQVHGKLVPFIELGVGFNPELTGRENVYLNGSILGFTKKQIDGYYQDVVDFAEIEQFMDQKLKNYSSGMQVRLAFACATRAEADVLLVDEVLAVGDADFQRKCFSYFRELKKRKKTVIFVTHDMEAIKEYCDKAVLINDSMLSSEGSPERIAEQYSKLFANKGQSDKNVVSDRWGNYDAKIIETPVIRVSKEKISVSCKIQANQDISSPIIGFRIENELGVAMIGTNNLISGHKIDHFVNNKTAMFKWEFANILSSGKYLFTLSVQSKDGSVVYDWWNNAASFSVVNTKNTPYPVSPDIQLTEGEA